MAEKESRAKHAMAGGEKKSSSKKSGGKKKSAKHVHTMHVKHADNADGGWIATHEHEPDDMGAMPKSEEHIIPPGMDNLQAHMADHMDQSAPEPQAPPAGGAPPMLAGGM